MRRESRRLRSLVPKANIGAIVDEVLDEYIRETKEGATLEDLRQKHLDARQQNYEHGLEEDYNQPARELGKIVADAMEAHAEKAKTKRVIRRPFGR